LSSVFVVGFESPLGAVVACVVVSLGRLVGVLDRDGSLICSIGGEDGGTEGSIG